MGVDLLKDSCAFSMTNHRWGNRRRADKNEVKTSADDDMYNVTKRLIKSKQYSELTSFQNRTKMWVDMRSVKSYFHRGVNLVRLSMVNEIENYLCDALKEHDVLLEKFLMVYERQIDEAAEKLNEQFNRYDYPTVNNLRLRFGIEWKWIAFQLPENIPEEVFKKEKARVEAKWNEAAESVKYALRDGFLKLIKHATDKLTVVDGGKQKVFHGTLIGNIDEFLETFSKRNIVNDDELQELIDKTRGIIKQTKGSMDDLRTNVSLRSNIANQFSRVEKKLDEMVVNKPVRKFKL
jgi:hypothetical protein